MIGLRIRKLLSHLKDLKGDADMRVLVTGVAGFIGFHVARRLLEQGISVMGVDNLNPYYAVALKRDRLAVLQEHHNGFQFQELDIADMAALNRSLSGDRFSIIIHLAAQAGVRYSLQHPESYGASNLTGHLNMLEFARHHNGLERMIYASSSSVYGGNDKVPFAETDPVEQPKSLYAATKRAAELMSHTYSDLYDLRLIGLRFFTVYGPWGRPDMALWRFTQAILKGEPITIFNHGDMRRDFTYIDDIVDGVLAIARQTPNVTNDAGHSLYNIGNNNPEELMELVRLLEVGLNREADKLFLPMQAGDVYETFADIRHIQADYGFEPKTSLSDGIQKFLTWFQTSGAERH